MVQCRSPEIVEMRKEQIQNQHVAPPKWQFDTFSIKQGIKTICTMNDGHNDNTLYLKVPFKTPHYKSYYLRYYD